MSADTTRTRPLIGVRPSRKANGVRQRQRHEGLTRSLSRLGTPLRDGRGSAAVPSSFMRGDLGVVEDWLTAVNEGAVDRLEALSHEQVDIVGPQGQGLMDRRVPR